MADTQAPLLDCRGIVKTFPGVQALKGVDFAVRPGRVHGLVGENGAGKSTLTKVIAGLYGPDGGTLSLDGQPLALRGTDDALARGIVTVHQDINLIPTQTVAENVFLANEPTIGRLGVVRMREMRARTAELLERYGIRVSPDSLVSALPNDQRKMVQIVKAISRKARVLLLDEPTSSLTDDEVRLVLRLIRDLAAQGTGIVFISHYLSEVFEVCDEITVLRDGAVVLATETPATSLPDVVAAMIGRRLETPERRAGRELPSEPLLEVEGLRVRNGPRNVSLTLHKGEILGITGLTGSGLTELAKALFGSPDTRREAGRVRLDGRELTLRDPTEALAAGIVLLTNDRLREGILPDFTIQENVVLPVLDRFAGLLGRLDLGAIGEAARDAIRRLRVRAPARRRRPGRSAAATSRRSCSPSGWGRSRGSSSWTSRPSASMSAPRPRSAR
ncbi:MAG: sugar ABC transporter ATP-binding protein [Geminicoccaceae bacterium]